MSPRQKPPEVRRYYFSTPGSFEWAEVVITSGGFFASVSDYGNYAFAWRDFGDRDFRSFLLGAEKDTDYFTKKLQHGGDGPGDVLDVEETEKAIKEALKRLRRYRSLSREQAREEWDLLASFEAEWSETSFHEWYLATTLPDASEFKRHMRNPQARMFVERILVGRLCPIFREELALLQQSNTQQGQTT
jgi:hypothetical protein